LQFLNLIWAVPPLRLDIAALGIGILFKFASSFEFVFEAVILIACGVAWAVAGFPRFTEVAVVGGLGLVCFGVYLGIIWNRK
jgi:hypothetical protein